MPGFYLILHRQCVRVCARLTWSAVSPRSLAMIIQAALADLKVFLLRCT